jgi:hypothetical protein
MSSVPEPVDLALSEWRSRLAAASRNVSELSELPDYAAARDAARGTGRLADEARRLVATMDELWQGVLLIGSALDRADSARKAGSRLWRGDAAAAEALAILNGDSITVDLAETPVLHRRLLAGPRATATVSPEMLLQTMEAAFDRARERLTQITLARSQGTELRTRLQASIARLPGADVLTAELAAADVPDPLDRLAALQALATRVEVAERAQAGIAAARAAITALQTTLATAEACRQKIAGAWPQVDKSALPELSTWLEQIARTLEAGRAPGALAGLGSWQALHDRLAAEIGALSNAVEAAETRRADLAARFSALRAKHRARGTNGELDAVAASLRAAMAEMPQDLIATARALELYEAALRKKV